MFIFIIQLATTLESLDKDDKIGCIVLTGGTRAFAGKFYLISNINILIVRILAGADIKEMQSKTMPEVLNSGFPDQLSSISRIKKPIIAAVNGFAVRFFFILRYVISIFIHQLGGGCELSMMCDIIYAGDKAEFGQPEIILGTIPGA